MCDDAVLNYLPTTTPSMLISQLSTTMAALSVGAHTTQMYSRRATTMVTATTGFNAGTTTRSIDGSNTWNNHSCATNTTTCANTAIAASNIYTSTHDHTHDRAPHPSHTPTSTNSATATYQVRIDRHSMCVRSRLTSLLIRKVQWRRLRELTSNSMH